MVSGDIRSSSERGDLQPQMLQRWAVLILPSHSSLSASSVSTADTRARSIVGSQRKFWINRIPGLYVIDRGARDYPLPPCTWTSSHKDSKQPRQSFNHSRYAHRNTVQITRMMALKGEGGVRESCRISIYMYMSGLWRFLSLNQVCQSMRRYSVLPSIYSVLYVHLPSFGR